MLEMNIQKVHALENEYHIEVELLDGVYSDAIEIPRGDLSHIAYTVDTTGTFVIEATVSSAEKIEEGTATWLEADQDEDLSPAVKAIRAKTTGADGVLEVACQ